MTSLGSRRARLALAVALAAVAAGASMTAAVVAQPKSVASHVMGVDWQCQQVIWVTTCTYVRPAATTRKHDLGQRDV